MVLVLLPLWSAVSGMVSGSTLRSLTLIGIESLAAQTLDGSSVLARSWSPCRGHLSLVFTLCQLSAMPDTSIRKGALLLVYCNIQL